MSIRNATAGWQGTLREGKGSMSFGSGDYAYRGPYSFVSRFEEGEGTNPEELIGAALAGCFSMALSGDLGKAGYDPVSVRTEAEVHLERVDDAPTITRIQLNTAVEVEGINDDEFQEIAQGAKKNCPVSRALGTVNIELDASLSG